ncbi:MAG: nitroreductase family protein, partial [Acidimicrobiia bacterium]
MEFKQVIGNRRSIRYFEPDRPVEKEKIQVILEAVNRSSRAVNADFCKAIVVYRDDLDPEVLQQLKT